MSVLDNPKSMQEWGSRYITRLQSHGVSRRDAIDYWVQSILWPNGQDLTASMIDPPELAADYDIVFFRQEREPLE